MKDRLNLPKGWRNEIFERDKRTCQYCLCKINYSYEIDHIIPYWQCKKHEKSNLVVACIECNSIKHDRCFTSFNLAKLYVQYQHLIRGNLLPKASLLPELQSALLSYAKVATVLPNYVPTKLPLQNPLAEVQRLIEVEPSQIGLGVLELALRRENQAKVALSCA